MSTSPHANATRSLIPHVEIYVGAPIDVSLEIRLLEAVAGHLAGKGEPALLLANFHAPSAKVVARRQIDLVVVIRTRAVVVEAKGFVLPVRGTINGPWQQLLGNGTWRDFSGRTNPYVQALDAKNALDMSSPSQIRPRSGRCA